MTHNKKHYDTITIIGILTLMILASIGTAINTTDIDETCNTNNALLKRVNGKWNCSITHYGELYYHNHDTLNTITITATNITYNITNLTQSNSYGVNITNESITITKNGTYKIDTSISFSGGGNQEYDLMITKNNVDLDDCEAHRKLGTGGDIGNAGITCLKTLILGDKIMIGVKDNNNPTSNINIRAMNINLMEIQ